MAGKKQNVGVSHSTEKHLTSNANVQECDVDMIKLERPTVYSPEGITVSAPLVDAECAKDFFFFGHCIEIKSLFEDFALSAVARFLTTPLMLLCSVKKIQDRE